MWDLVFTENEKKYLSALSNEDKLVQSTAIFSIKEAFYKFQYPISKTYLDFLEVEVALPDFIQVNVLSKSIDANSESRFNRVFYYMELGCVVTLIASYYNRITK